MIPEAKVHEAFESLDGKRIFLTGGTGFFGRSFLDFILNKKFSKPTTIKILSRDPAKFLNQWPNYKKISLLSFLKGEIQSFDFPKEEFDTILHFATPADARMNVEQPELMRDIIVNGMQRVLDFAVHTKAKEFLFTSSGAVYGKQPEAISHISEDHSAAQFLVKLEDAYGSGKRIAEKMGEDYAIQYKFKYNVARCFAFVGPHIDTNGTYAIGNFMRDAIKNQPLIIKGDGTPYRSYLFSEDLVVWLLMILKNGKNLDIYNVGSDQALTIKELAETVSKVLNPEIKIDILKEKNKNNPIERYVPSIEKAKNELGLKVWTDLAEAIFKSKNSIS